MHILFQLWKFLNIIKLILSNIICNFYQCLQKYKICNYFNLRLDDFNVN